MRGEMKSRGGQMKRRGEERKRGEKKRRTDEKIETRSKRRIGQVGAKEGEANNLSALKVGSRSKATKWKLNYHFFYFYLFFCMSFSSVRHVRYCSAPKIFFCTILHYARLQHTILYYLMLCCSILYYSILFCYNRI